MSGAVNLPPRPEETELRLKSEELSQLEKELVERELQLTTFRAELADFERTYLRTVGVLYAELDEIQARIADLIARRNPSSTAAQDAARQARDKAAGSQFTVDEATPQLAKRFAATAKLKRLYREVARRLHPDLATNETDRKRRESFMARANRAYEKGDEVTLRAILEEYEGSPEAVVGEGVGADLVRILRRLIG